MAFGLLQTERPQGFGVGYIPWSQIQRYAEAEGLRDMEKDLFVRVIHRVDVHAVSALAKEAKKRGRRKNA